MTVGEFDARDKFLEPPNILDEPQAKVALPLLFSLQGT
jgi:hypothetical protein